MSSTFKITSSLNPNRVFILQKSEMEKRLDPIYYAHEFNEFEKKLVKKPFVKFHQILKSINNGFDFRDYKESGTPYLKVANVKQGELDFTKIQYIDFNSSEISKNIQLKKGNLLLTRKGTFGNAFALDKDYDFVISSEVFYIELLDNSINPQFLEIFFNSRIGQAQFDKNKIGAIMGSLSQEAIKDLKIPLPSSEIQKQVVDIYKKYIAQKQKNEAEAEKLLSGIDDYLLKELGIKLPEPPENALKNRMFISTIKEISGNRIDPAYHQVYFHKLVAAITSSKYKSRRLGEEINEINYGASFTNDYVESGVPLLRIKDLRRNEIIIDKVVFLPESARKLLGNSFVKQNDFLISRSGTIGVVSIVAKEIDGFAFGSFMIKFNLKSDTVLNREFLSYYLNCKLLIDLIERDKIGAIQGNITIPIIKSLLIPVPPIYKQKEIADYITTIRQQAQLLKDKTKELLKKASEEIEAILLN